MMLAQGEEEEEEFVTTTSSMVKGKRSKRPRPLALATNSDSSTSLNISSTSNYPVEEEEEAEDGRDIEYMANCLILLAKGENYDDKKRTETNYYQCKTCNKSFSSFQALGGHRASHSKPTKASQEENMIIKTSAAYDDNQENKYHQHRDDNRLVLTLRMPISGVNPNCNIDKKSSKVHECSICGAGFSSGQALGGHMRRHRVVDGGGCRETKKPRINLLGLDLNLPAPEGDDHDRAFMPKEQVIVFSASSLVDCHY